MALGASRLRRSRGVRGGPGRASWERGGNAGCALPAAVDIQPACLGLYCGRTVLSVNGSVETYGECGVSAARPGVGAGPGSAWAGLASAARVGALRRLVRIPPEAAPRPQPSPRLTWEDREEMGAAEGG